MATDTQSITKQRSPAYPVVSLGAAIELAKKLWSAQRKQEGHIESVLKTLGYASRSGRAARAVSALDQYGLTEESGAKDARKVRLSDLAQDILLLNESDPRRQKALKTAALLPTIYAALWERYGSQLPDDALIRPYLTRDKNYNEAVVDGLLANYRSTLELAKLDKLAEPNLHDDNRDTDPNGRTPDDSESKGGFMTLDQELPILVGASNRVARIPFPMTEDDFDLLIGTLNLWKKKLLAPKPTSDAKGETSKAPEED